MNFTLVKCKVMKEKDWEYSSPKRLALKDYLEPTKSSKGSKLQAQAYIEENSIGIKRKGMDSSSGLMDSTTSDNGGRATDMARDSGITVKETAIMENGSEEEEKDTASISQKVTN